MPALAYVADTPPVSEDRFLAGRSIVVSRQGQVAGFALTWPMDGLLVLDNISVSFTGHGLGRKLMDAVFNYGEAEGFAAVALTTFRDPPWNGAWFRKLGFVPMPECHIGPALRALIAQQATYLDPSTRETLWRPLASVR